MRIRLLVAVAACSLFWLSTAHAQQEDPNLEDHAVYDGPTIAITWSPVHLVLPVFELTGEYRVARKMGVGVVAGYGKITPSGGTQAVDVWEVGAQFRYYVIGSFRHGMQLGAEALYLNASVENGNDSAVASGLAAGPFIGYKYTAGIGFTVDLQAGAQYYVINAEDNAGNTNSANDFIALININIGWSF